LYSLRGLGVISSVLGRAGEQGHQRRLADAKLGIVEWQTPLDVQNYSAIERTLANQAADKASKFVNPDKGVAEAEEDEGSVGIKY
jgi:hypothetical protein